MTPEKKIPAINFCGGLIRRSAGVVALAFLLLPLHVEAAAEEAGSRPLSLQLVSGLLYSPVIQNGSRPTLNYSMTALRLGGALSEIKHPQSFLGGNLEWLAEAVYSSVTKGPGDYMAGITVLFRYNFVRPDAWFVPYVQAGAGIVYNDIYRDRSQSLIGQSIEFTPQAGFGIHFILNRNWSVDLEAIFHHVSNAGLDERNIGVNSLGGMAGVTYFWGSN